MDPGLFDLKAKAAADPIAQFHRVHGMCVVYLNGSRIVVRLTRRLFLVVPNRHRTDPDAFAAMAVRELEHGDHYPSRQAAQSIADHMHHAGVVRAFDALERACKRAGGG